jgi:DNA-binding response OmpR family regulator
LAAGRGRNNGPAAGTMARPLTSPSPMVNAPVGDCFEFGEFASDRRRRLLRRVDGGPIALHAKPFERLLSFFDHAGQVVTLSTPPHRIREESSMPYVVTVRYRAEAHERQRL